MLPTMRTVKILSLCLLLAGCAGMDAAECQLADWRAIGYEDGVQGRGPEHFATRRKACAEHGVMAQFDAYTVGRGEGLAQYCRPLNGYHLGTQGHQYRGICPAGLESAFVAAHADGYGLYQRHATLKSIRSRLNHRKKRANEIERQLVEKTTALVSFGAGPSQRASLAVDLKQLAEEKGEVEQTIVQLERDEALAARDYEAYRRQLETNGLR